MNELKKIQTSTPLRSMLMLTAFIAAGFILSLILSAALALLYRGDPAQELMGSASFVIWGQVIASLGIFLLPALLFWSWAGNIRGGLLVEVPQGKYIGYAFALLFLCLPLVQYAVQAMRDIPLDGFSPALREYIDSSFEERDSLIKVMAGDGKDIWSLLRNLAILALLPAVTEELFFRGTIQRLLSIYIKNPFIPVVVTALVFTAIHFDFYNFPGIFILGMIMGLLYLASGSIYVPILFHFLHNGMSATAMTLYGTDFDKQTLEGVEFPFWLALASLVLVVLVLKKMFLKRDLT